MNKLSFNLILGTLALSASVSAAPPCNSIVELDPDMPDEAVNPFPGDMPTDSNALANITSKECGQILRAIAGEQSLCVQEKDGIICSRFRVGFSSTSAGNAVFSDQAIADFSTQDEELSECLSLSSGPDTSVFYFPDPLRLIKVIAYESANVSLSLEACISEDAEIDGEMSIIVGNTELLNCENPKSNCIELDGI